MKRRQLLHTGLLMAGYSLTAGCLGTPALQDGESPPGEYEPPAYSAWIPAQNDFTDEELVFTHTEWEPGEDTENIPSEGSETVLPEEETVNTLGEQYPILGLPWAGTVVGTYATLGLLFYPFSGNLLPGEESESIEGIETEAMTWIGNAFIFHGTYDPAVFEEEYSEDFETTDAMEDFTMYENEYNRAYAVSEDTLVVGVEPDDGEEYDTSEVVSSTLEQGLEGTNRLVDTDDGEWLFTQTGSGMMSLGAWQTESISEAVFPSDENATENESETPVDTDVESTSVIDNADSLINNFVATDDEGVALEHAESRFAAIYPDDAVPSEEEVKTQLISDEDLTHEITINGNYVTASLVFDETSMPE